MECGISKRKDLVTVNNDSTDHEKSKLKNNFNKQETLKGGVKKGNQHTPLNVFIPKILSDVYKMPGIV